MIIGFNGVSKSGKTEASQHLAKTIGAVEINFGDALKVEIFDALKSDSPPDELAFLPNSSRQRVLSTIDALEYAHQSGFIRFEDREYSEPEKIAWCNNYKDVLRPLMQVWGHEMRRGQDWDYWVTRWKSRALAALESGKTVVCGDVRYENEVGAIKALGGKWCRIVIPKTPEVISRHPSEEQILPEPDAEILNDRTQRFYRLVDYTANKFQERESQVA